MSFINDFKDDAKTGSHELKPINQPKRNLKPRFSVNLSDEDHLRVKEYCSSMGLSCAALARILILEKINKA
ncbi:hypothetical protein [uncultured Paraglaciecola sp.]|jgi:hypothetical protein|uniref:hypothetical protein n=1 Tax=uncultured Paraglaciecola sp. TaxID=1765024 RepID=UPI0030D99F94|tara:strand:- start:2825 stop:3037 length:213 start_codon:yes stop_codon:yes gene_type:complete